MCNVNINCSPCEENMTPVYQDIILNTYIVYILCYCTLFVPLKKNVPQITNTITSDVYLYLDVHGHCLHLTGIQINTSYDVSKHRIKQIRALPRHERFT